MELHWTDHLGFIIIGIVVPLQAVMGGQSELKKIRFNTALKLRLYWSNNIWMWFLTLVIAGVWWFNDRTWDLLGLTKEIAWPTGLSQYVFIAFVLLYLIDTFSEIYSKKKREEAKTQMTDDLSFLPASAKEYGHYIFLALTAGICEEIIFRGYFIRYFQCLFAEADPSYTFAILMPALIFGMVHLYQGWRAVMKITAMAVLFGYLFVYTNSLWLLIIFHALVDLIGGLIAWFLLAKKNG